MAKQQKNKFENRVRFNWGYHDAAQSVREGWATPENNFGFAKHGPLAGMQSVADVLSKHFDSSYAQGWQQGYFDAQDGLYENDSSSAWEKCLSVGLVKN